MSAAILYFLSPVFFVEHEHEPARHDVVNVELCEVVVAGDGAVVHYMAVHFELDVVEVLAVARRFPDELNAGQIHAELVLKPVLCRPHDAPLFHGCHGHALGQIQGLYLAMSSPRNGHPQTQAQNYNPDLHNGQFMAELHRRWCPKTARLLSKIRPLSSKRYQCKDQNQKHTLKFSFTYSVGTLCKITTIFPLRRMVDY